MRPDVHYYYMSLRIERGPNSKPVARPFDVTPSNRTNTIAKLLNNTSSTVFFAAEAYASEVAAMGNRIGTVPLEIGDPKGT